MQSSTNNHYLPDEFNDNFFYNDDNENKHLFFQSQPIINDQQEEEDDDYYLRSPINGKKDFNEKFSMNTSFVFLQRYGNRISWVRNKRQSTNIKPGSFLSNKYSVFNYE